MLEINDIHTYYGNSYVLQGVTLRVGEGEAVSLLGRNGVGKTTTIRSIIGFTPPRRGSIRFKGQEIAGKPSYRIATAGIGLCPQGRRIFPDLSVRENLIIGYRDRGMQWTMDKVCERFPRLKERVTQKAGTLSGGEQQMLAMARALMTNPDLLLLDEPSEGLAPLIVREIGRIVSELKQDGLSILLIEQNLSLATGVADRVYVMSKGRIVYEGTSQSLLHDEVVKKQYLGV